VSSHKEQNDGSVNFSARGILGGQRGKKQRGEGGTFCFPEMRSNLEIKMPYHEGIEDASLSPKKKKRKRQGAGKSLGTFVIFASQKKLLLVRRCFLYGNFLEFSRGEKNGY